MLSDCRYAVRLLFKSSGSTLLAVLALALGIGANTAMFSIINTLFLRPLPFAQPERLVQLTSSLPDLSIDGGPFSWPRYEAVRDRQQVFSHLAVSAFNQFTLTGRGDPEVIVGVMISDDYLATLGVQPVEGRAFSAEEQAPHGPDVALISERLKRRLFTGGAPALGEALTLDGHPHTIIGVLPASMSRFPFNQSDIWVPRPAEVPFLVPAQVDNGAFTFQVIGRLKDGVTLAQARENVKLLAADGASTFFECSAA